MTRQGDFYTQRSFSIASGHRLDDVHRFARDGLDAAQARGMQRETIFQLRQFAAIEIVAADGTTDMGQMHADLMGAPGFQPQADERAVSGGLLDAVMRHGALAAGADRALCARAEAGNRRVDDAFGAARECLRSRRDIRG